MFYGFFDYPEQFKPTFDPGMAALCPVCHKPMNQHGPNNIVTISLYVEGDTRSYFYRAGKSCYEGLNDFQQGLIDAVIADAVLQAKQKN